MAKVKMIHRYTKMCNNEELESYDPKTQKDENNVRLVLNTYVVIRETNKGFWIMLDGKEKWVSNNAKNRFAYPTRKQALENFTKRSKRSISLNNYHIRYTELALEKAKELEEILSDEDADSEIFLFTENDKKIFIDSIKNIKHANENLSRAKERHDRIFKNN